MSNGLTTPEPGMVFRNVEEGFVIKIGERNDRGLFKIRSSSGFTDQWTYNAVTAAINSNETKILDLSDCKNCSNPVLHEKTSFCRECLEERLGSEQEVQEQ